MESANELYQTSNISKEKNKKTNKRHHNLVKFWVVYQDNVRSNVNVRSKNMNHRIIES